MLETMLHYYMSILTTIGLIFLLASKHFMKERKVLRSLSTSEYPLDSLVLTISPNVLNLPNLLIFSGYFFLDWLYCDEV